MTAIPQLRPDIHLVMPEARPVDAMLAWLRAAMPGAFVQLARPELDLAGRARVFLLPDLIAHVASGLEAGEYLPELLAQWGRLAHRAKNAGADGFVLHEEALARDPAAMAQALAQWCPAAAGAVDLPALTGAPLPGDALVQVLIAAFLAADPAAAAALPAPVRPAHDAAGVAAAAARLGADRAALTREAAARREAAGWLEALRRTLWAEADRAAQAEARLRALESRLAEASRPAPDPALVERIARLEALLTERDGYIHKVHHSKSWTVTAPLRRFSRLLRRG